MGLVQCSNQLMERHACGAGTTCPSEAPVFTDSDYPFVLLNIVFFYSFGHCIVSPFLIYGFWLLLWYIPIFPPITMMWLLWDNWVLMMFGILSMLCYVLIWNNRHRGATISETITSLNPNFRWIIKDCLIVDWCQIRSISAIFMTRVLTGWYTINYIVKR